MLKLNCSFKVTVVHSRSNGPLCFQLVMSSYSLLCATKKEKKVTGHISKLALGIKTSLTSFNITSSVSALPNKPPRLTCVQNLTQSSYSFQIFYLSWSMKARSSHPHTCCHLFRCEKRLNSALITIRSRIK